MPSITTISSNKTTVMNQFLAGLSADDKKTFVRTVVDELNGLLGLSLKEQDLESGDYEFFLHDTASQVLAALENDAYTFPKNTTHRLIRTLTTNRDTAISSLINDIAEILFLRRDQRTEYVSNKIHAQPYNIRKLMLEYALKSKLIDEIVGVLTKGHCANSCDKLPTGCCYILGYDLNLVPDTMLELQEIEAIRNGHEFPPVEEKCKYHTSSGCTIALFKSPQCVGYLCDGLEEFLKDTYQPKDLEAFLKHLFIFRNCYIDRSNIFDAMDATIAAGRRLQQR